MKEGAAMYEKRITVTPHARQAEFFDARERFVAYGGARGGGKSWAMRMKLVMLALRYEGVNILLLRRTLGELRENHIVPLRLLLNGAAVYRETTREFIFPNSSRIKLGYCDAESDVLQYQGQAYEVIGLEEATHFTYFQFQCLTECSRLSGRMKEEFIPRIYLTCNPGGVGHAWVKRLFIDRIYRENEDAANYRFIRSSVYDNDYLMKNDPSYLQNLLALPPARRRAMLYGDWNGFEGACFPEFCASHVCRPFEIPKRWQRFRALDYGLDMTAALWLAVAPDARVYVYRELCEPDLIISEAAKRIKAYSPADEKYRYTVASPDLWNRRQDSGKSGFEILVKNGIRIVKADNRRIPGWRILREYLSTASGAPRLQIFESCTELIRCIPLLMFSDTVPEDCACVPHDITHAPEALRYALMSRQPHEKNEARPPTSLTFTHTVKNCEREYIDYK